MILDAIGIEKGDQQPSGDPNQQEQKKVRPEEEIINDVLDAIFK